MKKVPGPDCRRGRACKPPFAVRDCRPLGSRALSRVWRFTLSSVNALARRTCEVHDLTIKRDTPEARRTGCHSESEYWRSRASRYLDMAMVVVVAALMVLMIAFLFPLPLLATVIVFSCCVVVSVVMTAWCVMNYRAAMDFSEWSLSDGGFDEWAS